MRYEISVKYGSGRWAGRWMSEGEFERRGDAISEFGRIKSELKEEKQKFTIRLLKWEQSIIKTEDHDYR